jgi:hypothetical protein
MIESLHETVHAIVQSTPVFDIHTHLYPPNFADLTSWGIDDLVNYHYLIAELFRSSPITPAQFWAASKREQADVIWKTLFVENILARLARSSPIRIRNATSSTSCRWQASPVSS